MYIVSIDPGNNIGIAIYELDDLTMVIINVETTLLVLNNHVTSENNEDKLLEKLMVLSNMCNNLYNTYSPAAIIVEAAFLNNRFPKAVMQLSQYIATIELTFRKCSPLLKLFRFPPKYVKKRIGAGGNADKDDMTLAVNNVMEISSKIDPTLITEHEVDALAIGYVGIVEIRLAPFVLYAY